jgi:hypothetical protein
MRELKFRAWNEEIKEMIYLENSGLQYFDFEGSYSLGFTVDGYTEFWAHENYEETTKIANKFPIMQYIVTEGNQEIYEQDIIQEWKHDRLLRTFIAEDIRTFTREYDKSEHDSIWKVIGNTFENPNLKIYRKV